MTIPSTVVASESPMYTHDESIHREFSGPAQQILILTGHTDSVGDSVGSVIELADKRLVSASSDNTSRVWDLSQMTCGGTLTGHTGSVMTVIESDSCRVFRLSDEIF